MSFNMGTVFSALGMVLGGFVGAILGGNIYAGAMIGGALGGLAGAYFFPEGPKMKNVPPPEPSENRTQISTYGGMIPMIWGAKRIAGNIVWMADIVETNTQSKHRLDGERYYENATLFTATMAIAFCKGPINEVLRIWIDGELFVDFREDGDPYYTATDNTTENVSTSGELQGIFYDLYLGTEDQTADATLVAAGASACGYRGVCYIVFKDFPVGKFGRLPNVEIEVVKTSAASGTDEYLSKVIEDICEEAGIDSTNIDVTDFESTPTVLGYMIPRQMPARTALEPLAGLYFFNSAEIDWKLHFVEKVETPEYTIDIDDLPAYEYGSERPSQMVETRTQDSELPTHMVLNYESRTRDYDVASAAAVRTDKAKQVSMTMGFGVVLTATLAKQAAEMLLKTIWTVRTKYQFSTSQKYLYLSPGKVVTVGGKDMRIIEMNDRSGIIHFVCESESSGNYSSAAESTNIDFTTPYLNARDIIPNVIFIETAFRYDNDLATGFYVAFYHNADGLYNGGGLKVSFDNEYSWINAAFGEDDSAKVGEMQETFDGSDFDVDLSISNQTLESVADQYAVIGSEDSGWEIIQFDTATLVSGNTYTVSSITRNILDSQFTHGADEFFILLTGEQSIDKVYIQPEHVGVELQYRAMSKSGIMIDPAKDFTFVGE